MEVAAKEEVAGSVIWLHGLGADGHDFEPIVSELDLPEDLALRFVFPHAPVRPVTLNGGMAMRAWYDIYSLDRDGPVDENGIRESTVTLDALIQHEHSRGIPYDKIVVAGFSQGGAIASHCALCYPEKLAGLMALSTYLPLRTSIQQHLGDSRSGQSRDLRIFMAHGTHDPVLPMHLGQDSREALENLGYKVEWHEYPMQHAVCAEEINDISHWLLGCYQ